EDRAAIDGKVESAAGTLNLASFLERFPRQLSGGQRQRVAMGRAIVRQPRVFLFDEPLSNLDAKLRVQMRAEIKKLQHRLQITTIYVTHDQVEAMTMGHRIAILNGGKLQQVGAPLEVYERPGNLFVAGFIGTPPMNLVKGTLTQGGASARTSGFELPVPRAARGDAGEGTKVVLGIRPENLVPPGRQPRGQSHRLALTVEIVEVLGDEVVVHGRAGDETLVFKQDPHLPAVVGSTIEVQLELDALHLFDAGSELRLGA
ncbi:MAG TPA: ATP-binding cassette domain-containing protein, partial [Myxococcaceae bacterium]|nr:ATP-binding cassette domain-containing protein [Myxococcaceae bacterium]